MVCIIQKTDHRSSEQPVSDLKIYLQLKKMEGNLRKTNIPTHIAGTQTCSEPEGLPFVLIQLNPEIDKLEPNQ